MITLRWNSQASTCKPFCTEQTGLHQVWDMDSQIHTPNGTKNAARSFPAQVWYIWESQTHTHQIKLVFSLVPGFSVSSFWSRFFFFLFPIGPSCAFLTQWPRAMRSSGTAQELLAVRKRCFRDRKAMRAMRFRRLVWNLKRSLDKMNFGSLLHCTPLYWRPLRIQETSASKLQNLLISRFFKMNSTSLISPPNWAQCSKPSADP